MFRKNSVIGLLMIILILMLITGCSEIIPGVSLDIEKKKPDSLPEQALENQQATEHIPDQAQADLPFGPAAPQWSNEIEIRQYYDGSDSSAYYVLEPGDTVQPEINSAIWTEIYVINKTTVTVYFVRYVDDVAYGPNPDNLSPGAMKVFDYPLDPVYITSELTGYTLESIEPIEGYEHGWKINFVSP